MSLRLRPKKPPLALIRVSSLMVIIVLVPSAVVTCILSPSRAEMIPSTWGPSVISAASGGPGAYTVAKISPSDGSCACAAKLPAAVPVRLERSKRTLGGLESILIALLLQFDLLGL